MEFSAVNTIWVLVGTILIFFMQTGFAMLEAGMTRSKNVGNIVMKNLLDFCIGSLCFAIVGFGIMYGSQNSFFGTVDWFSDGSYSDMTPAGVPFAAFLIMQTVFCATASTIVSGAMAERTKFAAYCFFSIVISALIYPVAGHWIWGSGFLADMGFHDAAGSCAVHMVGGVSALAGAIMLGPRIGKYSKSGTARAIPGHSILFTALGVFVLWFSWFGFNGSSTVSMEGAAIQMAAECILKTNMSAVCAVVAGMAFTWILFGKPDVTYTLNAAVAGLVAMTAGCDTVSLKSSMLIGMAAGILSVISNRFLEVSVKIDDPVGAVGIHGICGLWGTLAVGLFSNGFATHGSKGLFVGGDASLLGIQATGALAVVVWTALLSFAVLKFIKETVGIRVSKETEVEGLDSGEHEMLSSEGGIRMAAAVIDALRGSYDDSAMEGAVRAESNLNRIVMKEETYAQTDIQKIDDFASDGIYKIDIICSQNKFEILKEAMNDIGVNGITVIQVLGCGLQKGIKESYRGQIVDMVLLPKVKVEIVVSKIPVRIVIETAKKVLYTGNIGDGKIFVTNIHNVVKIRTGEEGVKALQGSMEDELV